MKKKTLYNIDETTEAKIISVAYGNASLREKLEVFFLTRKNAEAKKLLKEYQNTAEEVHRLEKESMPEEIIKRVEKELNTRVQEKKSIWSDMLSLAFFKPHVSFAAAILITATIVISIFVRNDSSDLQYSQREVEIANTQTKQALALVGDILLSTKSTITKDIIPNRVVKPVNESFNYVNEFIKGEKNEKVN